MRHSGEPSAPAGASAATVRRVRYALGAVVVACVAGMIASAATKQLGGVVALGLVCSATVAALMLVSWLKPSDGTGPPRTGTGADAEARARAVEARISTLVSSGAPEAELRALAGEAVALGRATGR